MVTDRTYLLKLKENEMPKEIPVDALKAAVQKLNSILEEGKIKTVGKKKAEIVTAFAEKVSEITEAGKAKDLPGECIEFFNSYIVSDDDAADAADTKKNTTAAAGKKGAGKVAPAAGKKGAGKVSDKKEKAPKSSGVVALAVKAYMTDGKKTVKEIVDHLAKDFPGRDIKSTVGHVVCVLGHVKQ